MVGWKHRPYEFTCAHCGVTGKAASPKKMYHKACRPKARAKRVKESKEEKVADAERREEARSREAEGQREDGGASGGGVRGRLGAPETLQEEAKNTRVGREEEPERGDFLTSPSGVPYLPDSLLTHDENACMNCGDLYYTETEDFICHKCRSI